MYDPPESHYDSLKWILRYIQGAIDHGLYLHPSTSMHLSTYIDADWCGYPDMRSTSEYCCFLGNNLISFISKCQAILSRSSAEAEYWGVTSVVESCWLHNLLLELHCSLGQASLVHYDDVSSIYLSNKPVQHQHTNTCWDRYSLCSG